ncbi:MAG: AraC family transcriptional regulator [Ruminococcaceae bacterium]|nr:AraC family transcriptional regulator [Oscillospiraceae bacterium]
MEEIVLDKMAFNFYDFKLVDKEYAFDFSEKPRRSYELYYIENGYAEVKTNTLTLTAFSGDIIYIPPETKCKIIFHSEPDFFGRGLIFRHFPNVYTYDYPVQILTLNSKQLKYLHEVPLTSKTVDCVFIYTFYHFLNELQKDMRKQTEKHFAKIQIALDYMNNNDIYSIPELAKLCNMSESHFYATFKKITGTTPIQTKTKLQALKAEQLLKSTDLSIEEISHKVGFESTTHFRKIFYKRYGTTPKDFRKRFR